MKIIANVTLVGRNKDGDKVETPPGGSTDLPDVEAKDLIARGFAVAAGKQAPAAPATPPKLEITEADAPLVEILKGNQDAVEAALAGLPVEQLERLGQIEDAAEKPRKGVSKAIDEAIAKAKTPAK